jgi:hypothetical protein
MPGSGTVNTKDGTGFSGSIGLENFGLEHQEYFFGNKKTLSGI